MAHTAENGPGDACGDQSDGRITASGSKISNIIQPVDRQHRVPDNLLALNASVRSGALPLIPAKGFANGRGGVRRLALSTASTSAEIRADQTVQVEKSPLAASSSPMRQSSSRSHAQRRASDELMSSIARGQPADKRRPSTVTSAVRHMDE